MYALLSKFFCHKGAPHRGRGRWRRYGWLSLAGASLGLGVLLWVSFSLDQEEHRLRLSGFLGTVYAEGDQVDRRLEYPLVKPQAQGTEGQPVYALLHPETPASQLAPEKKAPKPRPSRKPKVEKTLNPQPKTAKAPAKSTGDKVTANSQAKKKKHPTPPAARKPAAG